MSADYCPLTHRLCAMLALLTTAVSPALAEDLKEEAARLCHAYIDSPQDFKEIPTQACKVHMNYSEQLMDGRCFDHSVRNSEHPLAFAGFPSGGTCASSSIARVDHQNEVSYPVIRNEAVNGYGFGMYDKALDYRGLLLITNGYDLRLVLPKEQVILCGFVEKFEGWRAPEPADDPRCQKFSRDEFSDHSSPIGQDARDSWPRYPEAEPFKQVRSDLNGDGAGELVVSYDYASGAGCGCDAQPLVLLHDGKIVITPYAADNGSVPSDIQALAAALDQLTMTCNHHTTIWSVVGIDGKDFVLADYRPRPWDIHSPGSDEVYSWNEITSRELYEFRGDKFVRICEQKPVTKKFVAHEVIPKSGTGRLDYVPPE